MANLITAAEIGGEPDIEEMLQHARNPTKNTPVLGITGTGGAGKSSLTDELIRRFIHELPDKKVAIFSIDPTKQKTGGALLGDRIRMNAIFNKRVFMRSLATRGSRTELSRLERRIGCRKNGRLRSHRCGNERNRARRCRNYGSIGRIDVCHDE